MVRQKEYYIMKKVIKFLYSLAVICGGIFITGCSSDDFSLNQEATKFDDLKFVVHVGNSSADTRAALNKKDWMIGDKIIIAIDGNDNNLCNLEYKGNGDWSVSKVNQQSSFANEQGKLDAVHADNLSLDGNQITTTGDILYTQNGSYKKHDNIVVIDLNMIQRPVARIAIIGMDKNCWIDGLKEYGKLSSLSAAKWNATCNSHEALYKEVFGDTCVFYGILNSNDKGETTINLSRNDGISYERIYPKTLKPGDFITLQGPHSQESSLWAKHALVHSITLDKQVLNLAISDKSSINADIYNKDADNKALIWSSSNRKIVAVDENGNVTALSYGDAQISVKAADGSASATCTVHVKNIEDFIFVGYDLRSSSFSETTNVNFTLPVTNNYSKPIHLNNTIYFGSNSPDVISHLSEFTISFSSTTINPNESSNIYAHMIFSNVISWTWGSNTGKQNYVTIRFTRDGDNKVYEVKKYLPWDLK